METLHGGQAVLFPNCGANVMAPVPEPSSLPFAEVIQTLQSGIDRGNMTISQYMAQQLEGGVDLTAGETGTTASRILTSLRYLALKDLSYSWSSGQGVQKAADFWKEYDATNKAKKCK